MSKTKNKLPTTLRHLITFTVVAVFMVMAYATAESDDRFQQIGYFKADNNHRVFTYNVERGVSASDIESHANGRSHTDGRTTYVFYYFGDAPNPTSATSLDRALQITENSDFKYSYMKMGNGQSNFTSHL